MAIKCPKCQAENPDTKQFCGDCGTRLDLPKTPQISVTKTLETTADKLLYGTTFAGRYEIIEELGAGGMGRVYRAFDKKIDEEVAIKLLKPEIAAERRTVERFRNELRIARKITHPNVCRVHDLNEEGRALYITMEYVRGEDLKSVIHRMGVLTAGKAISIACQVAEGLGQAHKLGIIHRDLKPHNIMIDKDGNAKIMDFGIARSVGAEGVTGEGIVIGTPEYMSPEQVEGKAADPRSDIYSLGVALFEMVTGRLPFEGDSAMSVALKHKTEMPPDPLQLNPQMASDLSRIILKCLQKDPAVRYQTAEELLADLAFLEKGRAPGPRTTPLPSPRAEGRAGIKEIRARSIAVLPFENRSGDPEEEPFVEGMHETLITELSKIKALKVIARPSVMRYKNSDKPLTEIAKELNVKEIIAGSALHEGERVRITVSLIEAESERNVWAEKYDRDYRDILKLHGEVALDIAQEIKIAVTPAEQAILARARPVDSEAQDLYLKGRYYWNKFSPELMEKAISYYLQSIEKDSTYALAHAGLAETYVLLSAVFAILPGKDTLPKAREAALKALALDPTLVEAHVSLGLIATCYDWDRQGAKGHFEKALELNPNSVSAHQWIEFYLSFLEGEYREGIAHLERAQELDPLNLFVKGRLGYMDIYMRDYDRAIKRFTEILDFDPNMPAAHLGLMDGYAGKGMLDEAIAEGEKVLQLGMRADNAIGDLGCLYGLAGKKDKALQLLSGLEARSKAGHVSYFWVAAVHLGLGEMDEAFAWFDKAYEERDGSLLYITVPAPFDALSPDPRYKQLLQKMGLEHLLKKLAPIKK